MTDLSNNPFYSPLGAQLIAAGQQPIGQQPATKQPASTGTQTTQPAGQLDVNSLAAALRKLANPPPAFGGQPVQPPQQQQVGAPMSIVPPGYGYPSQ
jgi:hypothetical protein